MKKYIYVARDGRFWEFEGPNNNILAWQQAIDSFGAGGKLFTKVEAPTTPTLKFSCQPSFGEAPSFLFEGLFSFSSVTDDFGVIQGTPLREPLPTFHTQ